MRKRGSLFPRIHQRASGLHAPLPEKVEDEISVDLLKRSLRGVTITAEGKLNAGCAMRSCAAGLGEVLRFTYGHEVTEMPQFHFSTPSCLKSIAVQAM